MYFYVHFTYSVYPLSKKNDVKIVFFSFGKIESKQILGLRCWAKARPIQKCWVWPQIWAIHIILYTNLFQLKENQPKYINKDTPNNCTLSSDLSLVDHPSIYIYMSVRHFKIDCIFIQSTTPESTSLAAFSVHDVWNEPENDWWCLKSYSITWVALLTYYMLLGY